MFHRSGAIPLKWLGQGLEYGRIEILNGKEKLDILHFFCAIGHHSVLISSQNNMQLLTHCT